MKSACVWKIGEEVEKGKNLWLRLPVVKLWKQVCRLVDQ